MKKALKLLAVVLVFFMCFLLNKYFNTYSIYRNNLNTKVYLSVLNPSGTYTVQFDSQGGTPTPPSRSKSLNETVGTLPNNVTKEGYNFIGWWTLPDGSGGTQIEANTVVTGDVTYYAHWEKIVCKKAAEGTLHFETCSAGGGCLHHVSSGTVMRYGNIPTEYSPKKGDAYDCDVNYDGVYNPTTERFYFVREISETSKGVLVHYTSFDKDGQMDSSISRENYTYDAGKAYLPDSTLWSNPKLSSFDSKVSRYINEADLIAACGDPRVDNSTAYLSNCTYLMENSRYQSDSYGRTGIWIDKINDKIYRIQTANAVVQHPTDANSKNTVRPVIEVPINTIEGYKERNSYRVTFQYKGGNTTGMPSYYDRYEDQAVGTLPQPTKDGFTFDGWYTDEGVWENEMTSATVITGNVTVYAKWEEIIDNMEYVFYIPGNCTFNGSGSNITSTTNNCISTINPTGSDIDYTSGDNKYINTGVSLYSHDNIGKDYEIGFTITSYVSSANPSQATFVNTKNETTGYPGLVFRKSGNTGLEIASRKNSTTNETYKINDATTVQNVKIYRTEGSIYYSINGGTKTFLNDLTQYNPEFDLSVWFGATPTNAAATTAQRYLVGTLSNLYIKLESDDVVKNTITFHANGGTCDTADKEVTRGKTAGALPTPTYVMHAFDGWYTAASGGTEVTSSTIITRDIDVYAHWKDIYIVEFHGGNGTVSPQTIYQVVDGGSIGSSNIPTATYADHYFDGWYTSSSGGTKIDGTETITADTDYYARYKEYRYVTFNANGGTMDLTPNPVPVPDGDSIGSSMLPTPTKQGETFVGWYTHPTEGTQIYGTELITQNVTYYAHYSTTCHVTFDGNGGTPEYNGKDVACGAGIGALPTAENNDVTVDLDGWYLNVSDASTKADENTTISSNVTYHAKWVATSKIAVIGNIKYDTLADAVSAVPTNGVKTTITMLNNTAEKVTIDSGRNVYLDLNGKKISYPSDGTNAQVFTLGGSSAGTLELTNGTVTSNKASGMINVNTYGNLVVNTGTILNMTGTRQAIYVNGGTLEVLGGTITNKEQRGAIHVLGNGTATITGGTITSTNQYGIYNEAGTLIIGTEDGSVDTSAPVIKGKLYGVLAKSSFEFYDGILEGIDAPVGKATDAKSPPSTAIDTGETYISAIETGTEKAYGTDGSYQTLYLEYDSNKYTIILNPMGGQVSKTVIKVEPGDPVGPLPVPTKGAYDFGGWYDSNNQPVNDLTEPSGDDTYHAVWNFTPSHVTFNIINTPMRTYYTNIGTWKNTEASFQTNMDNNFNSNNCTPCDSSMPKPYQSCAANAAVQCDKPKGYETGVTGTLNIYEAVQSNGDWVKGSSVSYVTATSDGTLYDMIPGKTYYWELDSDNNVYGTVTVQGERRILEAGTIRNIRDLGGFIVDVDDDGTADGVVDYGRMFRGPKLNTQADVTSLLKLGVTEEVDLRGSLSEPKITNNYQAREIVNYEIDPQNYSTNAAALKSALTATMNDVINGQNIYFHCAIGTDRTGTMAWFLEGLLGVSREDRIQDYELSYFYGLLNRHRFYSQQPGSSITHRFTYMDNLYPDNDDIYDYYVTDSDPTVQAANEQRVQDFRDAVITYYQQP